LTAALQPADVKQRVRARRLGARGMRAKCGGGARIQITYACLVHVDFVVSPDDNNPGLAVSDDAHALGHTVGWEGAGSCCAGAFWKMGVGVGVVRAGDG